MSAISLTGLTVLRGFKLSFGRPARSSVNIRGDDTYIHGLTLGMKMYDVCMQEKQLQYAIIIYNTTHQPTVCYNARETYLE